MVDNYENGFVMKQNKVAISSVKINNIFTQIKLNLFSDYFITIFYI
jgi:hypothetical protein